MTHHCPLIPETPDRSLVRYGGVPMTYVAAVRYGESMAYLANAREEREGIWRDHEPVRLEGGLYTPVIAWQGYVGTFPVYCVECGQHQPGHADCEETLSGIICEKCR